jgi:antitoxin MazE
VGEHRRRKDMKVSVQRTGDDLSVPIPPDVAAQSNLLEGSELEVVVSGGRLILTPQDVPSLEELVSRITPENRHEEIDFGPPVGKEVW